MKISQTFRANRPKLLQMYGDNTVEFHRCVFLSTLGRSFAGMLLLVHVIMLFPGVPLLDTATKLWLAPFILVLSGTLFFSAYLAENGKSLLARHITNLTVALSTMISVILCGGFFDSHATPFLMAPIIVAFCISPRVEALLYGTATFITPIFFDLIVRSFGWEIPNYTSLSSPMTNTIFLFGTLYLTILISLNYLQKTNTELHEALRNEREVFEKWAVIDPLTEIGNRRAFDSELESVFSDAQLKNERFAVLFLDLNEFKGINDTYGHEEGDEVLRQVSKRLDKVVRDTDSLCRLGGDEFGIVARKALKEDYIDTLIYEIQDALILPFNVGCRQHQISTSVGVAIFPNDADSTTGLMRAADMDMYRNKANMKRSSEKAMPEKTDVGSNKFSSV